jgi:peptidyl-prolyl cis-trans isomerase SurA
MVLMPMFRLNRLPRSPSRLFGQLLLAALLLGGFSSAHAVPQTIDKIVAVVNDSVVLQSELDRQIKIAEGTLRERGISAPPADALRSQVLDRIILNRLQTQRAADAGIRVDDRELNEVIANIAAQNKMSLSQFADALKKDGIDFLSVRDQVRDEMLISRVRQKEVGARVLVTEQDVDLYLANAGTEDQSEYKLSHILVAVPDGATPEVREKAKAKAEGLLKRLKAGEDFAQLAITNSDGQQALQGGELDWRKGANLPTAFAPVAPKLALDQVSDVIEAANGFNIIKLTGKREAGERKTVDETKAEHILLMPNAIRDEDATVALSRELYDRLQKGEDFATLAKKYSDDPGSKNSGGDLGWQPPGVFAPDFQTRIDQLKIGDTTPPFHTQFGWHIARVLERRTRDTTVESRRAAAKQAIQARKEAEEYEGWLRRLKEEAYVEYRLGDDKAKTAS